MSFQLDFAGEARPYDQVASQVSTSRRSPISTAQAEIMRVIGEKGSIRSVEAGVIIHAARRPPCNWHGRGRRTKEACCRHASSDGTEVMKRLMKRGFVKRAEPGVWIAL